MYFKCIMNFEILKLNRKSKIEMLCFERYALVASTLKVYKCQEVEIGWVQKGILCMHVK